MKNVKEENSNLRSKIRRLEEDNARKRKEIDALYDPSKVCNIFISNFLIEYLK